MGLSHSDICPFLSHTTRTKYNALRWAGLSLPPPWGRPSPWEPTQDQLAHSRDWLGIIFITCLLPQCRHHHHFGSHHHNGHHPLRPWSLEKAISFLLSFQTVPTIKSIELLKVQIPNEDKSKSVFEYKVVSPTIKTCDSLGANFD